MLDRTVLLRVSDKGEPINNENISNGVLILPSRPLPKKYAQGDLLFELLLKLDGGCTASNDGVVYTNVPKSYEKDFDRYSFSAYTMKNSFHEDITVSVPIYKPGTYCYYIEYTDIDNLDKRIETKKFYFYVPPILTLNGNFVPFNAINIQTLVSKWIGPLEKWEKLFEEVSFKGYNMVHFTPLQERGESNSPYSIYDQLRFDPNLFSSNEKAISFLKGILHKHSLLSLTDVVWNHTANNSEWIRENPDAGYNAETAPHLKAAIELDGGLIDFSNKLKKYGLPSYIDSPDDLERVISAIDSKVLGPLKLWEYYVFHKQSIVQEVERIFKQEEHITPDTIPGDLDTSNIKDVAQYALKVSSVRKKIVMDDRFSNELDASRFLKFLVALINKLGSDIDQSAIYQQASKIIDEINLDLYASYDSDIKFIKQQIKDRIYYLRLDENGPKLGEVTASNPLTEPYFTRFRGTDGKDYALANNGWIWGGNPLVDFASDASKAYLRREVIVWGDCVKLRYGNKAEDSPSLWKRMIEYTKQCASCFDGFRIDNCHSTPLHVGEKLLDVARQVNPNLYVVAELFTGSEEMDKIFVERLGISSLIREAMQAWNVSELSRLVHKHGGRPIGSMTWLPLDEFAYPASREPEKDKYTGSYSELEIPKVLTTQQPHALFMDCTHDNLMPAQKRTVEDTLPNAALVAFCSSAIGSLFGYDECYPKLLDVVNESRQYSYGNNGIRDVKKKLHHIRKCLAFESEDILRDHEMYIHHEGQFITIQRYNARTGKGWFLIARSKFSENYDSQTLSPVTLSKTRVKSEFSYTLKKKGDFVDDKNLLKGVPVIVEELNGTTVQENGDASIIHTTADFIPGSIAVFSTSINDVDISLDNFAKKGAVEASLNLDLYDLNVLMYRCEAEERDYSDGREGVYNIPGYGDLIYAGLEGWISVLKNVIWQNDLAHPICDHLRNGEWAFDYVLGRLEKYEQHSKSLGEFLGWLKSRIEAIRVVPYFLRPHYFGLVIGIAYEACRFRIFRLMPDHIQVGTNFVQSLALTSVQMIGRMKHTSLVPKQQIPCIAAGLPHFSSGYMRCWGRDVFISFRGLFLIPGRYEDARQHILGFAKTLKHGLIPNLLNAGLEPRYNARDAAWFFLQSIQDYIHVVPNGFNILDDKVSRRFPQDDKYIPVDDPLAFSYESSIRDIIYEILLRHASGITYREANAGPNLDSQMKDEGFNVKVYVDWNTGLIHGGSQWNCGTWMDKMGESEKAGSKGYPGTPRDGAAVEIQGLLKSALRFINELQGKNLFEHSSVIKPDGSKISFEEWEKLVQQNFERCFHIPEDPAEDDSFVIDPSIVNRRGVYKDLFQTGKPYEDYQLRPNFPIAMVVAPELFTLEKAWKAIQMADEILRGPIGMKTLDPSDWNYRPYYNNGLDTDDFATSKGRNYHQGPEWVWCMGYFLRAYLYFRFKHESRLGCNDCSNQILTSLNKRLQGHKKWIRNSPWSGLTELTNKNGELCGDSSPTQAWSTSCILDLYFDLYTSFRL